jgi:hypothetical protein
MLSQYKWVDFRPLLGLMVVLGACGYEPPSSVNLTSGASSSGMGGAGGTESSSSSSSSSSSTGDGGKGGALSDLDGGLPGVGGVGGVGGGLPGVGGAGGAGGGNSTGGSGGAPPWDGSEIENCGQEPCDIAGTKICCLPKAAGSTGTCHALAICPNGNDYALECDDKSDCDEGYCCLTNDRAKCNTSCSGSLVCKTEDDCPPGHVCDPTGGSLSFCKLP